MALLGSPSIQVAFLTEIRLLTFSRLSILGEASDHQTQKGPRLGPGMLV